MSNIADDLFDNYVILSDIVSKIIEDRNILFPNEDDRIKALEYCKNLHDSYNGLINLLTKEEEKEDNQWEDENVWQKERD